MKQSHCNRNRQKGTNYDTGKMYYRGYGVYRKRAFLYASEGWEIISIDTAIYESYGTLKRDTAVYLKKSN